jgi:DNA-3-methyladenine glycosylase I
MTYCEYVLLNPQDTFNKVYHDTQYGFPIREDNALFERLVLEINQAGLSWLTILKKADNFRRAYEGFDVDRVSGYGEDDRARLLADAGIVRNRLKVDAAIENARRIQTLRTDHGSFANWLDMNHPMTKDAWTRVFRKTFVFTGGEIVREFLISTGYLAGAHDETCPVFSIVAAQRPPWQRARL